ncbi:MAG: glycerol kinase [Rhodopirellula sp. TMED11]|nr:MAG: glycerol kinase [Rhodopirellula sp. TMED11]
MTFVMALDQGTTSSRAILFDQAGNPHAVAQQEFTQHYPQPGWVEHDANEIWQTQCAVAQQVLRENQISASQVTAIGITNQRETTVIWDRATGQPIAPAIVWQDRRTAGDCQQMRVDGLQDLVLEKTGLVIDAYFCASKIRWLLNQVPGAFERAKKGELAFGTIDSWLIWKLSGGTLHVTDITNASRTMLMDLDHGHWDDHLLDVFQIPREILPTIVPSSQVYGETTAELFGQSIKIAAAVGDQQSALFGQNCTKHGMAKNTYGTGCFMLMNTGTEAQRSTNRLLTTAAATVSGEHQFALEGSVFVAGAAVQWLRDGLQIIDSAPEVEELARSVPDSGGVYVVPAMAGLGAPIWDAEARGTIVGITRGTTKAHIGRATLEGIAFQVADVFDAMRQDAGIPIDQLRVDGGAAANDLLMQFQADIMQTPVIRPVVTETTALGAAYLAGLATGFWENEAQLHSIWQAERRFEPQLTAQQAEVRRARWKEALKRAMAWEKGNS